MTGGGTGLAAILIVVVTATAVAAQVVPAETATGSVPAASAKAPGAAGRIVGGSRANPAEWPFAAALYYQGRFTCGGSVIAPSKVLTAAHCAIRTRPEDFTVVTGRPYLRDRSVGEELEVSAIKVYPGYRHNERHDLAVLTLASSTDAPPATLPGAGEGKPATAVGTPFRVAGWGARNPNGRRLSPKLRQTVEFGRPHRRCGRAYGRDYMGKAMICALGSRINPKKAIHRSACSGDSGGPLISRTPAGPRLVGVVSFGGFICGDRAAPSVYARVSAGIDFVQSQLDS